MGRAFSLPKLSLKPLLAIAIIVCIFSYNGICFSNWLDISSRLGIGLGLDWIIPKLVPARVDDSRTFTAAKTSFELSPGYDFPLTTFFSMTLPSGLPEGTYQAFAALAEPGSVQAGSPRIISDISLAPFSFTR